MKPRILLVNPAIHDFAAFDFWVKPHGMLQAAGFLRKKAELRLFDYLDRRSTLVPVGRELRTDEWGRGEFHSVRTEKPAVLRDVPRNWRRYGIPREHFQAFFREEDPFDFVLIQTVMTYWYPGVREVIEDVRTFSPSTKIVLGGVYATLCPRHAEGLGADAVISGTDLGALWRFLELEPDPNGLPFWEGYSDLEVGVMKLTDGCPFRCTYCSVPNVYPPFRARPLERSLSEFDRLCELGVEHIAFYDDALLFRSKEILLPFLKEVGKRRASPRFHCPNAVNARFIDCELADAMVEGGFTKIYLGFESRSDDWQVSTGGKVSSEDLPIAVENLVTAGLDREHICAYLVFGHPEGVRQDVEASLQYASEIGIRSMLADFSPIPGTRDGEACRRWVDLDEPLNHNKTAFPIRLMGKTEVDRLKALAKRLNARCGQD